METAEKSTQDAVGDTFDGVEIHESTIQWIIDRPARRRHVSTIRATNLNKLSMDTLSAIGALIEADTSSSTTNDRWE